MEIKIIITVDTEDLKSLGLKNAVRDSDLCSVLMPEDEVVASMRIYLNHMQVVSATQSFSSRDVSQEILLEIPDRVIEAVAGIQSGDRQVMESKS